MARPFAEKFYASKEWQNCRRSYIANVHGLCERCLARDIVKPGKILHHIIELSPDNINDPDITLNHSNLEFVCQECHNEELRKEKEVTRDGLTFDENGDLIQISPPNNV